MYTISSKHTTYRIPLDSLDLNQLRHFENGSTKPMPLWRVPSGEDYYEFKLNAWRILESDDEEEEAENLPSESLLCHICNIYVPVIYINKHNNSDRHNNMKKILNLIVLRGKNSDLNQPCEAPKSESCYYCEDCSLVVSKNSNTHEQSYTHKKSLRNKDLIDQFLKFYSEDLSDNINNNTQPLKDYFNNYINRKNLPFKINVVNGEYLKIIINGNSLKIKKNNFHSLIETETEIICLLCEVQVGRAFKLIECHVESKKHRKRVTRNIDDKHCIREFNDDFSHCILCNELVLITRVAGHKRLTYHTSNLNIAQGRKNSCDLNENYIFSAETKENSFRNLKDELADNENILSQDSAEECDKNHGSFNLHTKGNENGVCHDINVSNKTAINNFYNHVYEPLQSNKHNVEESNIRSYIDTNDQSSETDIQGTSVSAANLPDVENINKVNINQAEIPIVDVANNDIDTEQIEIPSEFIENIYYLVLETIMEKEVICKVCNVLMSNSDLNLYNHFNGDGHTTKYNDLLKANRVTKAQNKFFCYSCKVSVTSKNELEHIFGIKHRNKFPNDSDVGPVYCGFCKVYFSDMVQEHQNSKEHIQACMANGNNVQKNIFENQTEDNRDIDDEDSEVSDTVNNIYASVAKTGNVFLKLNYHLSKTSNPSEVLCKICDRVLPNSVVAIDSHIEGYYHTNKYTNLLEFNKLVKDGNRFHCKICDVFVTIKNEIEHIAGIKHNMLSEAMKTLKDDVQTPNNTDIDDIQNSEDEEIAPASDEEGHLYVQTSTSQEPNDDETIDDIDIQNKNESDQVSNAEATNVTTAKITQADFSKLHYHVAKTSNPSEVLCKVCNVALSNSVINIDTHIQGFSHSHKYRCLLEAHRIERDDNRFHCEICDVFVANKNEIEHIAGFKHKSKLPEAIETLEDNVQTSDDTDVDDDQYSDDEIVPASDEEGHLYVPISVDNEPNDAETIDDIDIQSKNKSDQVSNAEATNFTTAKITQADFSKLHYHVAKTSNPSEVLCKVCNVTLSNSVINIDTHIQGLTHSHKYRRLLEAHRIERDDNRFHCEICDVFVANKNEIEHIAGFKHKSKLPEAIETLEDNVQTSDDTFVDNEITPISNEEVIDDLYNQTEDESHEAFNVTTENHETSQTYLPKPHYHFAKTSNPLEVLCKICHVIQSNTVANIDSHIEGFSHSYKYDALLESNRIEKDGNRFLCKICDVFVGNKNELEHIFGSKHKIRRETNLTGFCIECHRDIPACEKERHVQSMEHLNMCMNKLMKAVKELAKDLKKK